MSEARPSVFIVDDHSFFRAGLRSTLTEHGFTVATREIKRRFRRPRCSW